MANPLVSIIIPAYNRENLLGEAIDSALAQDGVTVEVIVVDDGSSDGTFAIAKSYQSVTAVTQKNAGVSTARNHGLSLASGDYLIFLDSDDRLKPDAASIGIAALEKKPEFGFVFGGADIIAFDGSPLRQNAIAAEHLEFEDMIMGKVPTPAQCMFRTKAVTEVNGCDTTVRHCEDYDLCLRVLATSSCCCHGGIVCDTRWHGDQVTAEAADCLESILDVTRNAHTDRLAPAEMSALRQKAVRQWKTTHGSLIAFEVLRKLRRGRFAPIPLCLFRFFRHMPYSGIGLIRQIRRRFA